MRQNLLLFGAALVVGLGVSGLAQAQYGYPPYDGYGYYGPPSPSPAWNYDPYTNGTSKCVQWDRHDPESCARLTPSYGQPGYAPWPRGW